MFKEMSAIMGMLRNPGKIQEQIGQFRERITQLSAEASAGGNMVTAKVNGALEVVALKISDEALKLNDTQMLEDLIIAAVNQAMAKVRVSSAEESRKLAEEMGIPPGMMGSLGGM